MPIVKILPFLWNVKFNTRLPPLPPPKYTYTLFPVSDKILLPCYLSLKKSKQYFIYTFLYNFLFILPAYLACLYFHYAFTSTTPYSPPLFLYLYPQPQKLKRNSYFYFVYNTHFSLFSLSLLLKKNKQFKKNL